jgi:uncharacterized protein YebE (UPF0316 family)
MLKLLLIFIFGTIETYLFAGWSLSANKKQAYLSSILMFVYMCVYLMILEVAFKDSNSKLIIMDYALACALGNYIRVKQEKKI